jgi:hypothetical protein
MRQPAAEAADARLAAAVAAAAGAPPAAPPALAALVAEARAGDAGAPWHGAYQTELFRAAAFAAHETMDHPVACLLVLTAEEAADDPRGAYDALRAAGAPPLMRAGAMDPDVLTHYLVAHGSAPGAAEAAAARLHDVAGALGPACRALPLGGGAGGARVDPALWAAALREPFPGGGGGDTAARPAPPPGGLAAGLAPADAAALAALVQDFAARGVVPHLEARIRTLDAAATAARRGLKNQLKSLLFRRPSEAPPATAAPLSPGRGGGAAAPEVPYPHASPEGQLRRLADLALMVGDAETATSTLRLLAADLKADRAELPFAAAREAAAVAAVFTGAPDAAADAFKEAVYRFPPDAAGRRGALRAALLARLYLAALGRHADAAWMAMKAHRLGAGLGAGLHGALAVEAAARALLRAAPPRARKAAFYLTLAGGHHAAAGQPTLARRAYLGALAAYEGHGWVTLEQYVHERLGGECRAAGDTAGAARHLAAAVCCPGADAATQSKRLAAFLGALREAAAAAGGAPPEVDLPLPVVDAARVGLAAAAGAGYADAAARAASADGWRALEAALQAEAPAAAKGAAAEAGSVCVGEDICIDVQLENPLAAPLSVTALRLECAFEPAPGAAAPAPPPGGGAPPPALQLPAERITLGGGERATVMLRARPLRPGRVRVEAVAWTLEGEARGRRALAVPRPRGALAFAVALECAADGDGAAEASPAPPSAGGLAFRVLPPMPRLEVSAEGLPATLLEGQVARCTLVLRNAGSMTLHGLAVAAGSAEVFVGGGDGAANGGAAAPAVELSWRGGVPVFRLPPATKLGVGQELRLPAWVRAAAPGPALLRMLWRYEPVVRLDPSAARFRALRAALAFSALPALAFSALLASAAAAPGAHLLHLRALNLQGAEAFALEGVRIPGGGWALGRLEEPEVDAPGGLDLAVAVAPEAAAELRLRLRPLPPGAPPPPPTWPSPAEAYFGGGAAGAPPPGVRAVDVVLRWSAAGGAARGFAAVRGAALEGPPVHAQLAGPVRVAHDFARAPLCRVDLVLRVRNLLPAHAELRVEAGGGRGGAGAGPARAHVWCGRAAATLPPLAPGASAEVPLQAAATGPGWLALADVAVHWRCEGAAPGGGLLEPAPFYVCVESV